MSHGRLAASPAFGGLLRLFDGSSLVGLTDGELLARFVATRDEAAFEGLVVRLGPMVLGVARRMLGPGADADDAFQATFLVLVRRAGSVGRGELIGPWLHGVAVRVCRKARAQASRRQAREQTGVGVDVCPPSSTPPALDGAEIQAVIDAEIARLPTSYRRLIILCDVEGLTRAEAADRLGWTPNMVRGRLARARGRLRANLTRRGCVPAGLGESSAWSPLPWMLTTPPEFLATTARAALASLSPPGRGATLVASTSALSLAEGVIRTMFLTSGKFLAAGTLLAGTLATGSGFLIAQTARPGPPVSPAVADPSPPPARPADPSLYLVRPDLAYYLANKEAFPGLTDTFLALYEAANQFGATLQSPNPAEREAAKPAFLTRVRDLQRRLQDQQPTDPLVAKQLELIRLTLAQTEQADAAPAPRGDAASLKTLQDERLRSARLRLQAQQAFYNEGRITIDRLIDASRQVMQAEHAVASSPAERRASLQRHVDQLRQIHDRELGELEVGRATSADVAEAADKLLEARILLAQNQAPAVQDRDLPSRAADPLGDAVGPAVGEAPRPPGRTPPAINPGKPAVSPPRAEAARELEARAAREDLAALNGMAVVVARKLFADTERLFPSELPVADYLTASDVLLEAELAAATTPEARAKAFKTAIDTAQRAREVTEDLARRGEKNQNDKLKAYYGVLKLQARAADDRQAAGIATPRDVDRRMTDLERKVDRILDLLNSLPDRPKVKR